MARMSDSELQGIVKQNIAGAVGSAWGTGGSQIAEERQRALDYYYGEPFGNEVEGRSQVVSTDVADTIEWLLPNLIEIFLAGSDVVRFEPSSMEDEAVAKQATEYVNHIFHKDNNGFQILYDMFKDALLQKNGVAKVYWEETDETKRETFEGLTEEEMALILDDDDVEAIEHEESDGLHDLTILRKAMDGRVRIETFPLEEFGISQRSSSLENAPFTYHRMEKTITELIEAGFDKKAVMALPSHDEAEYTSERLARFNQEDDIDMYDAGDDESMRRVWVYECYMRVDYDGDGLGELRKVTVAGSGYEVLENIEIDENPIVSITPIPMPHKFFGQSIADLTMDIQLIKSTLMRQVLDNAYLINNNRVAVNQNVNLDDLLTNRPGGVVRIDSSDPVGNSLAPMPVTPLGGAFFDTLEYMDQVREARTGVSRYNQGLDPDSLNKTATGINLMQSAGMKRQQMIARVFAETGVKEMFRKILRLIIKHQDKERMIRLRGEWVPMDPRAWNASMDVSVEVGIGYGNKEEQMMMMRELLGVQERIVSFQGGADGPLVNLENIHNTTKKLIESAGLKSADPYFSDPNSPEMQQAMASKGEKPDPEMMKVQAEIQADQAKTQAQLQGKAQEAQLKAQTDMQQTQMRVSLSQQEQAAKLELEREKMYAEMQLEREKTAAQLALEEQKANAELELRRAELGMNAEMETNRLSIQREIAEIQSETQERVASQSAERSQNEQPRSSGEQRSEQPINITVDGASPKKGRLRVIRDADGRVEGVEEDD